MAADGEKIKNVGRDERPFLPELAWAYFSAYSTILYGSLTRYKMLRSGIEDADKYLTMEGTRKILKATLPHQSQFIDENEPEVYHYLLDELELSLLAELRKIFDGRETDEADAVRAQEINKVLNAIKKSEAGRVFETPPA